MRTPGEGTRDRSQGFGRLRTPVRSALGSYLSFARGETRFSPWALVYPFGLIARFVVAARNFAFDHGLARSEEPPIPVVSVGNITLGGTNKTPFVEMLCRILQSAGVSPGIISRGYGGRTVDPVVITADSMEGESPDRLRDLVGDEPLLLASRLPGVPVAVSKDRLRDVDVLSERDIELIVADDAFQHRRMGRDADIVLVDACCPFGNGWIVPAGILRESPDVLSRASAVVITKSEQVSAESLEKLVDELTRHVPRDRLFFSRISLHEWRLWNGGWRGTASGRPESALIFSAIGSPESFRRSLLAEGVEILREHRFKDHYRYRVEDMRALEASMAECGAPCMICTEKDVYNMPHDWNASRDILVPFISTVLDDEERFRSCLLDSLRPRMVVASNGYGEDSMGVLLARKLSERFPSALVSAFPIVGRGEHYSKEGIPIDSTPSDSPSDGVIKYRLVDLWRDLRAGLLKSIAMQMGAWRKLRGRIRTPLCVGDVYLLLHTLWGQGQLPVLVATAKTVYLSGHWRLERFILKHRSRMAWTRDRDTAEELRRSGAQARFDGNPIMDITCDNTIEPVPWGADDLPRILLLPGSRRRAYDDLRLLLRAVERVQEALLTTGGASYMMVVAPTLDTDRLLQACEEARSADGTAWMPVRGSDTNGLRVSKNGCEISFFFGPLPAVAGRAHVLIGLGGTANQVCAGMGVPVVSIEEKGKFVQKKLLGDSEILVPQDPQALADAAVEIIGDDELRRRMSEEGVSRLGGPGALDRVADYAATRMGWGLRVRLYDTLAARWK
ncbi:MAG: tetraacyldisaccharide 4'-kinase [Synergistaceae bacterium]|nr:tetraacyldisaccharide 4'-kinase [Synergistota bacterium]NLM71103.1 tetraacyldisaccharide 4'-kinase [Synergistaceae bacterium]